MSSTGLFMNADSTARRRPAAKAIIAEAVAGIVQRPGRSIMTALGTVIGVTVLLAVLALTSSASKQVSKTFDLQEATFLRMTQQAAHPTTVGSLLFPLDAPASARLIHGVDAASLGWQMDKVPVGRLNRATGGIVLAATPGYADVAVPTLGSGRTYDEGHEQRAARVAVLGRGVASDLGIDDVSNSPTITVGGIPFSVVGIIDDVQRMPELLGAVVIPAHTALQLWGEPQDPSLVALSVAVAPGAAHIVGDQLPTAVTATHPDEFEVHYPPDPEGLRESINGQLQLLFIVLAGVCLVIGIIGITNTTFIAVVERTGEIGLRRAMGASSAAIALQFVLEAGILGVLGGCFGTALGVLAVVAISAILGWTAVVPMLFVALGPVIGLASGSLGGIFPALRASALQPVDALRQ